jgi:hypothetical protein
MNDMMITAGVLYEGNVVLVHQFRVNDSSCFNFNAKYPLRWDFTMTSRLISSVEMNETTIAYDRYMTRGPGVLYTIEKDSIQVDSMSQIVPIAKKMVADDGTALSHDSDPSITPTFKSINMDRRIFTELTANYNKNIMFALRLNDDNIRSKIQLKSINFISQDTNPKTFRWKLYRNSKIHELIYRTNVFELQNDRNNKIIYYPKYYDRVDVPETTPKYVTPNDLYLHHELTLPKYKVSDNGVMYTINNESLFKNGMLIYPVNANTLANNPSEKIFPDDFEYSYMDESNIADTFKDIQVGSCEVFSRENKVAHSTTTLSAFTVKVDQGKAYYPLHPNDDELFDYSTVQPDVNYSDYGLADIDISVVDNYYDVDDKKGELQLEGVVSMTNEKEIDISSSTPMMANIEGESDRYILVVEHITGESINIQGLVQWIEFK